MGAVHGAQDNLLGPDVHWGVHVVVVVGPVARTLVQLALGHFRCVDVLVPVKAL